MPKPLRPKKFQPNSTDDMSDDQPAVPDVDRLHDDQPVLNSGFGNTGQNNSGSVVAQGVEIALGHRMLDAVGQPRA